MEKGHTANIYVSVWVREAVNKAGDEAISGDGALFKLACGPSWLCHQWGVTWDQINTVCFSSSSFLQLYIRCTTIFRVSWSRLLS